MSLRRVQVFKHELDKEKSREYHHVYKEVYWCDANFHEFGVCYEEFEGGIGNYSVAIVELDCGKVESIEASLIRFIDTK